MEDALAREGAGAAMQKHAALNGFDFAGREAGVDLPRPNAQQEANVRFFLAHDAPAAFAHELDLAVLRPAAARIVVGAGSTNRGQPTRRCAEELAAAVGAPLVEFPGGHTGSVTHPTAFAARLSEVFDA